MTVIAQSVSILAAATQCLGAAAQGLGAAAQGEQSSTAILFFFLFIAVTMGITWWASRRTRTTKEFYAAGGGISAVQNGFALAGDYMSAASFLGIAGLVSKSGFDGLIYSVGWLVGWPVVMFLIAEPLRNLGRYTFSDVVAYRLRQKPTRIAAASGGLVVITFYMIAQMVGAGNLIRLLFPSLTYEWAVALVGCVMLIYVLFGGMLATTWVQIIKAVLLVGGASLLAVLVLAKYGFNPVELFRAAAERYPETRPLEPGELISNPWDAVSLGLALMMGTAGLPHILMRFYTVPNARAARTSVFFATGLIGWFYLVTFILGFGACVLVGREEIKAQDSGGNMAAVLLAKAVGGDPFMGFISAVAFATILAVVAGLTLSGAAAVSHDLWTQVVRGGSTGQKEELRVARIATVGLGLLAIGLGILFKGQNVAFMVSLAFALAASSNFPALFLATFFRGFSTAGAVACMAVGTLSTLTLIALSPTVLVDLFKYERAIFPLKNPAIITIPLAFITGIVVSLLYPEPDAQKKWAESESRMLLGAEGEGE